MGIETFYRGGGGGVIVCLLPINHGLSALAFRLQTHVDIEVRQFLPQNVLHFFLAAPASGLGGSEGSLLSLRATVAIGDQC